MKRLPPIVLAAVLAASVVSTVPLAADAATKPGKFAGTAGGTLADATFNGAQSNGLGNLHFLVSGAKISSTATPKAVSASSGAVGMALGRPVPLGGVNLRTAGPTSGSTTGSIPGMNQQGVSVNKITSTNNASFTSKTGCSAGTIAESLTKSSGVTVDSAALGPRVQASWGTSSTMGRVRLDTVSGGAHRSVVSEAAGTVGNISLMDGRFVLEVTGHSTLTATATGQSGGASVDYQPAAIAMTMPGRHIKSVPITRGGPPVSRTVTRLGKTVTVTFQANNPSVSTPANGQSATGKASLLSVKVSAQPGGIEGSATMNLVPLEVIAIAPAGGVTCPAAATGDPTSTDLETQAPPTSTAPAAVTTSTAAAASQSLASTGGPTSLLIALGVLLIAGGAVLVPFSVRRRRHG